MGYVKWNTSNNPSSGVFRTGEGGGGASFRASIKEYRTSISFSVHPNPTNTELGKKMAAQPWRMKGTVSWCGVKRNFDQRVGTLGTSRPSGCYGRTGEVSGTIYLPEAPKFEYAELDVVVTLKNNTGKNCLISTLWPIGLDKMIGRRFDPKSFPDHFTVNAGASKVFETPRILKYADTPTLPATTEIDSFVNLDCHPEGGFGKKFNVTLKKGYKTIIYITHTLSGVSTMKVGASTSTEPVKPVPKEPIKLVIWSDELKEEFEKMFIGKNYIEAVKLLNAWRDEWLSKHAGWRGEIEKSYAEAVKLLPQIGKPKVWPIKVSRGEYNYLCYNEEELKQIREFLGLDKETGEPTYEDMDTYLSKLSTKELGEWRDYWIKIWKTITTRWEPALTLLVNAKYKEYTTGKPTPVTPGKVLEVADLKSPDLAAKDEEVAVEFTVLFKGTEQKRVFYHVYDKETETKMLKTRWLQYMGPRTWSHPLSKMKVDVTRGIPYHSHFTMPDRDLSRLQLVVGYEIKEDPGWFNDVVVDIPIKLSDEPTAEEVEPGYPKIVSRGPYSFRANNAEELKYLQDFLGIRPAADDIDTYLTKVRDSKIPNRTLEGWNDYWIEIWNRLKRNDLAEFTTNKYNEYALGTTPIPPPDPVGPGEGYYIKLPDFKCELTKDPNKINYTTKEECEKALEDTKKLALAAGAGLGAVGALALAPKYLKKKRK